MSVSLICPQCGRAADFYALTIASCPACGAAYPEPLRRAAEAALARQRAPRPLLLSIGMVGSALFAALASRFLFGTLFGVGTYTINDESVSA